MDTSPIQYDKYVIDCRFGGGYSQVRKKIGLHKLENNLAKVK